MTGKTPDQVSDALAEHIKECGQRYDDLRDEMADHREDMNDRMNLATAARDAMAADIKRVLAVFNHRRGFLAGVLWATTAAAGIAGWIAWAWDHLPGLVK